jgi:1,4-dihydroxy-2-naphthoate polyprenyltransferase
MSHNRLQSYALAARPWSFAMSLISVVAGTLLAAREGGISWPWFVVVAAGVTMFHAGGNIINDYFDTRAGVDQPDSPTARYRPHPILAGLLTPRELLLEAGVLLGGAVAAGLAAAALRTIHVLWIGLAGLLLCVSYTAGPLRLKYRACGEVAVFLIWGPLMIEGAYAVQRDALSLPALYLSFPFGALVALVLFANNMRDIAYDARHEVRTVGILLGAGRSYVLFAALMLSAYAYVTALVLLRVLGPWGLLIYLSLPKALRLLADFRKVVPDAADALTARLETVFGVLLMAAILLDAGLLS